MSGQEYYSSGDLVVTATIIRDGSSTYAVKQVVNVDLKYHETMIGGSNVAGCAVILGAVGLTVLALVARAWPCGILFMLLWGCVTFYRDKSWTLTISMADGQQIVKRVKVMHWQESDGRKHPLQEAKEAIERAMAG